MKCWDFGWIMLFLFWYAFRPDMCTWNIMSSNGHVCRVSRAKRSQDMLWPLVLLFSLPCLVRPQSTHPALSLESPLSLSANNFSTSASTPLLFSLPTSSQLTVSVALCASPSSNPPTVFVSNSTDSQVIPGPNGGSDVFEITLGGLGLGNLTLDVGDSTGLLAVYGGTTSDNLEIGVSQGGMIIQSTSLLPNSSSSYSDSNADPRAARKSTLLWRLDSKRSTPFFATFLPTSSPVTTNIPELYTPTSKHDPSIVPTTTRILLNTKLHTHPCPTRRGTPLAPADCMRSPRARYGRSERCTELAGPRGADVASRRARMEEGVACWPFGRPHEL